MDSPVTNSELQLAIAPLQKSIDRIEGDLRNLDDRIARLPDIYLSRADYQDRHKDVVEVTRALQVDLATSKQWANDQHASIKAEFLKEIQTLRQEMQDQNRTAAKAAASNTKWLVALLTAPLLM